MRGHDLHRELDSRHSIIQERLKRERPKQVAAKRCGPDDLSEKRAPTHIPIKHYSDFISGVQKLGNVEMMSGMILNRWQTKFASKLVASEMHCLKAQWRLDEEPVSALTRAP